MKMKWWKVVSRLDEWLHRRHLSQNNPVGRLICDYSDYLITGSWHPEKD